MSYSLDLLEACSYERIYDLPHGEYRATYLVALCLEVQDGISTFVGTEVNETDNRVCKMHDGKTRYETANKVTAYRWFMQAAGVAKPGEVAL